MRSPYFYVWVFIFSCNMKRNNKIIQLILIGLVIAIYLLGVWYSKTLREESEIFLYRRDIGYSSVNNGPNDTSYFDILAITNYLRKTITIDSFIKLGKNYVDSVKSDNPVSMVIFMCQEQGTVLPDPPYDNHSAQLKHYVIAIDFDRDKKSTFRGLAIWKDGGQIPIIDLDVKIPSEKTVIDSLINNKCYAD